ncbi:MAG: hypothetical protein JST16_06490 [Bdellovibrionales bacterium]|nr:hypothetical protein [Bdellovibrionales bacterium]
MNSASFVLLGLFTATAAFADENLPIIESLKGLRMGMSLAAFVKRPPCEIVKLRMDDIHHSGKPTEDYATAICRPAGKFDVYHFVDFKFSNEKLHEVTANMFLKGTALGNDGLGCIPAELNEYNEAVVKTIQAGYTRLGHKKDYYPQTATCLHVNRLVAKPSKMRFEDFKGELFSNLQPNAALNEGVREESDKFWKHQHDTAFWFFSTNVPGVSGDIFYNGGEPQMITVTLRKKP